MTAINDKIENIILIKVFFRVFFKGQFVTRGGRVIVAGRRGVGCRLGATRARGRSCTKLDRPHRRWMQFARGRRFPRAPQSTVHQETEGCAEGWDASKKRHQYRHAVGSTQVRGQMPTVYCFCKIENHRTTRFSLVCFLFRFRNRVTIQRALHVRSIIFSLDYKYTCVFCSI